MEGDKASRLEIGAVLEETVLLCCLRRGFHFVDGLICWGSMEFFNYCAGHHAL